MKYERKDVISWTDDARVSLGSKYYVGQSAPNALATANNKGCTPGTLITVDEDKVYPFRLLFEKGDEQKIKWFPNLVKVRSDNVKRVPFDLSKKEDRDTLRGRWVRFHESEELIRDIFPEHEGDAWEANGLCAERLFRAYVFADGPDEGEPVGKLVEIENGTHV